MEMFIIGSLKVLAVLAHLEYLGGHVKPKSPITKYSPLYNTLLGFKSP